MFRYVTLSVILGSFFVASVNSQRPLQACQCQVSIYQRRGCLVPGLLTPAKCSEVGCCFDPNYYRIYLFASAPRCYAPQGDCSRANCQVERSRRQSCGNLYRFACERVGCCFSFDRYGSSCYRAASPVASTVAITTTTTRAPTTTTRGRPVVLIWSAWGQWSACSNMCTRGIRARTRQCTRGGPVASRVCPEQSVSQTCNDDLCRSWDSWKNVMPCSITCGGIGKAFTTRVCLDRGKIGPQICYLRENGCIRPACVPIPAVSLPTWSQWEQWGVCSSSCTPGNQYRGRRCRINSRDVGSVRCSPTDPQGQSLQKRPCNGNMCKLWGPWSRPVPCPTSCGETPVPSGSTRTCWFGAESPRTQAQQIIFDRCSTRSLECPELNCYVTARFAAATTPKGDFSTLEVTSSVQTTPPVETQSTTLAATTEMPTIATTATTEMPTIATTATTASTTTSATTTTTTATVTIATSALIPKIATTATTTTTTETPTTASTEMSTTATTPTTTAAASSSSQEATIVFQIWNLWSACSQSCGPGIRSRLKICLDREGNNLTQDDEKCPEKSQNQGCNLDLCNEWTDWGPTECLGGCDGPAKKQAIGTRRMTRECAQLDKSKGATECYNKTRSCVRVCPSIDVTLSLPKSWGVWAQWGQCSSSCASGTRSRSRECPDTTCQGSSTESEACNQNLCDEWSEWAGAPCSASCGEGERISTRSCLDNSNNNVISSDEQCYRRVETCRQAECDVKTDDVIDFLFLVDSSNRVDDCPALETSGVAVPVTSQTMSNVTTPNYLKIKEFMKDFTRDWKSFDQNKSRVAIQLISGPCKPKTDNNLNLVRTFADEPETLQSDIESFPYICGKFWLDWALRCTKSKVLTPSNGDRADVPTVVVALLAYQLPNSRPGKFLLSALSNDIVRTRNATILSLSATDPGSLSALGRSKHEEMLTTLSCGFFPSCPRFLGSIWDKNRGSPAQRIREALKA